MRHPERRNDVRLQFAVDAIRDDGADFVQASDPREVFVVGAQLGFGFGQGGHAGAFDGGDDRARRGTSVSGLVDAHVCADPGFLHNFLSGFDGLGISGGIVGLDDHDADEGCLLRESGAGQDELSTSSGVAQPLLFTLRLDGSVLRRFAPSLGSRVTRVLKLRSRIGHVA